MLFFLLSLTHLCESVAFFGINGLFCTLSEVYERQVQIHIWTKHEPFWQYSLVIYYWVCTMHNAQCTNTLSILIFILLHSLVIITVTHTHTHSHFVTIGICMCSNLYRTKSSEQSLKARKQKLIMLHVHCAVCKLSKQKSQHRQYSNKWQKVQ